MTMGATIEQFRARHSEFGSTPDSKIQASLDDALVQMNADVWGALLVKGQCLLAAHQLASGPGGTTARLSAKSTDTLYSVQFRELQVQVACGLRP